MGKTTVQIVSVSMDECVCPAGTSVEGGGLASSSNSSKCVQCSEGLNCPLGGILSLLPNFYSSESEPFSVFRCLKSDVCPGGRPGSCAGKLFGQACSRCPDRTVYISSHKDCQDCNASRMAPALALLAFLCLFLLPFHVGANADTRTQSGPLASAGMLCAQGLTSVLVFQTISNLNREWINPLGPLFRIVGFFSLGLDYLNLACIAGSGDYIRLYLMRLFFLPFGFLVLILVVTISKVLPRIRTLARTSLAAYQNSFMTLLGIFFIPVCSLSLKAFQCVPHPSGVMTLSDEYSIDCWRGGSHAVLVVCSIVAILAYPVSFLAITALVTLKYVAWTIRFGKAFISRTRFLVHRMQHQYYYFGFFYNVRNFSVALVPVITLSFTRQILIFAAVLFMWLVAQMSYLPWRFYILNRFDTLSSVTVLICLLCTALTNPEEDREQEMGWVVVVLFLVHVCIVVGVVLEKVGTLFRKRSMYGFFLSHHKGSAGLFARRMKMLLQAATARTIFLDVDNLQDLDSLEFAVRNTSNFVILLTDPYVFRFWCVVEVVNAHLNNIPTILVHVSADAENVLSDYLRSNVGVDMWTDNEIEELISLGISQEQVSNAFKFLSSLEPIKIFQSASDDEQKAQVRLMLKGKVQNNFGEQRLHRRVSHMHKAAESDTANPCYIVYDSASATQLCVTQILADLMEGSWRAVICGPERGAVGFEANCVALVLISRGLFHDALGLGLASAFRVAKVALVTAISQEEFAKPSEELLEGFRQNRCEGSSDFDWELALSALTVNKNHSNGDTVEIGKELAVTLELLSRILGKHFNPQNSERLLLTEFQAIESRLHAGIQRKLPSQRSFQSDVKKHDSRILQAKHSFERSRSTSDSASFEKLKSEYNSEVSMDTAEAEISQLADSAAADTGQAPIEIHGVDEGASAYPSHAPIGLHGGAAGATTKLQHYGSREAYFENMRLRP